MGGESIELNKVYNVDCLVGMCDIDDQSIDLIFCDLPYEKLQGMNGTVLSRLSCYGQSMSGLLSHMEPLSYSDKINSPP